MMTTTLKEAIHVETHLTVDWEKLGRVVADAYSDDQARFLIAFHEQVEPMQLAIIGADTTIPEHVRFDLASTLRQLADHIDPAPVDAA